MNWDDLRIVAAVSDRGSYAGASARLRIDETTVARRVARIQGSLGVTLFDAVDGVRKPTGYCEAILAHVHDMLPRSAMSGKRRMGWSEGSELPRPIRWPRFWRAMPRNSWWRIQA